MSHNRIDLKIPNPFLSPEQWEEDLARGGERSRCHRPLSLSRFPIRVSTINKFVLHSPHTTPSARPSPTHNPFLFYLFISLQDTQPSRRSRRPGNHSIFPSHLCLFYYYCYYCFISGSRPCKCFCCRWARLLALSNCCQHFQPVPV